MSASEVPVKADHLNEISDSVAAMVACILQERLAPIREAIREHSRLLDWHSALLNHSTIMNHYNVGKLDDLRDLQTNVNYKLQFQIDPEDRRRPTLRGPQHTSALRSTMPAVGANPPPRTDDFPPSECSPPSGSSSILTERLPIPESFLRVARLNIFGEPTFEERRCEVEQMRYMKNLFRGRAT